MQTKCLWQLVTFAANQFLLFFFCYRCLVQIEELIDILIDSEGKVIVGENIPEESENVEVRNTN
mgnify:CR=1 FL=1